ncbi:MAG: response regulator, partial [Candidatus Binatia bacterium]
MLIKTKMDAAGSAGQATANVLVLDDSQSVLQSIRMTLSDPGFHVILCERAEEALSVMEQQEIDLAISDIRMPGLDGHGFLDRALEIDPNVDVMFITGFSTVEEAVSSLHRGAIHYLPKPFSPTLLLQTVKEVIAARHQAEPSHTEKFERAVAPIIGQSPLLLDVMPLIEQFSQHST